jgi:uncharacterized tellurite resistance protein B-like protein
MLRQLSREDRLHLMKFVCSFAWADLEIQDEERGFVNAMIERLELEEDRAQVLRWLKHPPAVEEIDPTRVPRAHKELFVNAIQELIEADDHIAEAEAENFELFKMLLA